MKFYVYVYRDPRPRKASQPVYVGKGTNTRDMDHWIHGSHNKPLQDFNSHLRLAGLVPIVDRVFETDDECEAFAEEVRLIALYGRRNLKRGTLFNLTDGGEGGSGRVVSPEEIKQMKYFSTEHWKDPAYREKVISRQIEGNARPEVQARRGLTSKETWARVGPTMGAAIAAARQTPESREKTKQQALAQWADPIYAAKMKAIKAEIDTRPEVSEARSSKLKARWGDPVEREQRRAAMKAAAKDKYKPVHAMPEDKTHESVTAFCAACGVVRSTAYIMLKGGEMKQGKFKGWTLKYV